MKKDSARQVVNVLALVIMLIAATGITSAVVLTRGDVAYGLVIVWAFAGIAIKHASTPVVATAAWALTPLVAVATVLGTWPSGRGGPSPAPTA